MDIHDNVDEGNILSERKHIKKIVYMILFTLSIRTGKTNVWWKRSQYSDFLCRLREGIDQEGV